MPIEVFTSSKPALPYRALILSLLLFALACLLAGGMAWTRSPELLGPRIMLPGWEISFRPPRQFMPGDRVLSELGPAVPFYARLVSGMTVEVVFRQIPVTPGTDTAEVCRRVLRSGATWPLSPLLNPQPAESIGELGQYDAVELQDPRTVVRAVVLPTGHAYTVSLGVERPPIDWRLYRLFDLTWRSIEFDAE